MEIFKESVDDFEKNKALAADIFNNLPGPFLVCGPSQPCVRN